MNEIEHDRRLAAAWRNASREEPSPQVDAAIRAAARQAVDATPGRSHNKHWWYPLAAAATVAVLAVGIAQLTPPEEVAPTFADRSELSSEARQAVAQQSLNDATLAAPSVGAPAAPPTATLTPRGSAPAAPVGERPRATANLKHESAAQAKPASPPGQLAQEEGAAANTAPPPAGVAPAPPASPPSEPFPAASDTSARRSVPAQKYASTESASAGSAAEPQQLQRQSAAAAVAAAGEAKVQDASARSVEDWIRRIRDLKNAGRTDEAARELAAFHATYGERADALLPADLQPGKR